MSVLLYLFFFLMAGCHVAEASLKLYVSEDDLDSDPPATNLSSAEITVFATRLILCLSRDQTPGLVCWRQAFTPELRSQPPNASCLVNSSAMLDLGLP